MQRNWNPYTLLVGINGAATLENSLAAFQNAKHIVLTRHQQFHS